MRTDQVIQSGDFAFKDSKGSGYGVGRVWCRVGANKYVLGQVRGQFTFAPSFAAMLALAPLTIWLMTNLHDGFVLLATWDRSQCSRPIHCKSGLPLPMATTKLELQAMPSEDWAPVGINVPGFSLSGFGDPLGQSRL